MGLSKDFDIDLMDLENFERLGEDVFEIGQAVPPREGSLWSYQDAELREGCK